MPIKITRQTLEVLGSNLGEVTPEGIGTLFTPFVKNNWSASVEIDTLWETVIHASGTKGAEDRISLRERPVRSITSTITGMTPGESVALQNSLLNMMGTGADGKQGVPFPIYCDRSTSLVNNFQGATDFVLCATQNRRFYRGQRVVFVPKGFKRRDVGGPSEILATGFYGTIDEIRGDGLLLVDPVDFDVLRGDYIYPLIDIHPSLNFDTTLITDEHSQARITVVEKDGNSTLPPSWIGDISYLFDYYNGYPIFDLTPNWTSKVHQSYDRLGTQYRSGRTSLVSPYGEKPVVTFSITETLFSRKEAWDLLRFFDSRRGRTLPFWTIQPLTSWQHLTINNSYIDVPNHDYVQNLIDFVQHIGIEDSNDTLHIKKVSDITNQGGFYRISFTPSFLTLPTVKRVAPAYLTRFNTDNYKQVWTTESIHSSNLEIRQLLAEETLAITNL